MKKSIEQRDDKFDLEPLDEKRIEQTVEDFSKEYINHDRGLFILAPSGVGKTHFVNQQKEPHWIDGDKLWQASGAHPDRAWWTEPLEVMNEVDRRSDVVSEKAMEKGLWIMGASINYLVPDAIVVPPKEQHLKFIKARETGHYDGGAKSNEFDQVQGHIDWMRKQYQKQGVPFFESIQAAVDTLVNEDS